jgi:hypothetical protein
MRLKLFLFSCLLSSITWGQDKTWAPEQVLVTKNNDTHVLMGSDQLFYERVDLMPQAVFWKQIMQLSPDSCLVNVAANRQILTKMAIKDWNKQSEYQKSILKDSLKRMFHVDSNARIYVTTGKNDFYKFNAVYPSLSQGVKAFEANGVDPWYAQAILLIESPGQLKKSSVGAYGAFQLMPGVARNFGLVVNKNIDERKNFNRSAYAASKLIANICIPEAKKILNKQGLSYNENDLWFRLMVLHVYHAGAMNVDAVVKKINPTQGGIQLIQQMWQNTAASFGNNSQNYTQLALAAQLILHEMIYTQCDEISFLGNDQMQNSTTEQ